MTDTIAKAGAVSRILGRTDLKRGAKTQRWSAGFEVMQMGPEVRVDWSQGPNSETTEEAYRKMREALAPKGYRIEKDTDDFESVYFRVARTETVKIEDVRLVLNKGRRFYEYTASGAGFAVEKCEENPRMVEVSFKAQPHTTFEGDRQQHIDGALSLYAGALEEAGYTVLVSDGTVRVGLEGSEFKRAVKGSTEALADLRVAVESAELDYYTKMAPGGISLFVVRVLPNETRRTEIFYNDEMGRYVGSTRFGGRFGAVHTSDLAKVVDFLRTELSD